MPMELKYFLSENKNEAIIELWEDNKLGYFVCDAATLEGLIRGLAQIRRNMSEQVSPELDPMSRIETEAFPAWMVPDTHNAPVPGAMLCLRHAGLGWLGFLLEREQALRIGKALEVDSKPQSQGIA